PNPRGLARAAERAYGLFENPKMAEDEPENDEDDDGAETSTAKLFGSVPRGDAAQQFAHALRSDRLFAFPDSRGQVQGVYRADWSVVRGASSIVHRPSSIVRRTSLAQGRPIAAGRALTTWDPN